MDDRTELLTDVVERVLVQWYPGSTERYRETVVRELAWAILAWAQTSVGREMLTTVMQGEEAGP